MDCSDVGVGAGGEDDDDSDSVLAVVSSSSSSTLTHPPGRSSGKDQLVPVE